MFVVSTLHGTQFNCDNWSSVLIWLYYPFQFWLVIWKKLGFIYFECSFERRLKLIFNITKEQLYCLLTRKLFKWTGESKSFFLLEYWCYVKQANSNNFLCIHRILKWYECRCFEFANSQTIEWIAICQIDLGLF